MSAITSPPTRIYDGGPDSPSRWSFASEDDNDADDRELDDLAEESESERLPREWTCSAFSPYYKCRFDD
jgi:hypothetical protein